VSMIAQPPSSATAQTLMNCSGPPSGMRSHLTPAAMSIAPAPISGPASKG
jgi:hypothetical protein